jgi:hypothetical protein
MAGKLVKHVTEVAAHLNRSVATVNKMRNKSTLNLCRRGDGFWDLEKVTAWQALREELGHPPTEDDMKAANLSVKVVSVEADRAAVEKYKLNRVEILAEGQMKRQGLANKIIARLNDGLEPDAKKKLTYHEMINALRAADGGTGILYDKERLEMGESTENVAVIVGAIKDLKRKREREYGL